MPVLDQRIAAGAGPLVRWCRAFRAEPNRTPRSHVPPTSQHVSPSRRRARSGPGYELAAPGMDWAFGGVGGAIPGLPRNDRTERRLYMLGATSDVQLVANRRSDKAL